MAGLAFGCGGDTERSATSDDIVIGAALPFTGERATIGRNLEQALLLAIADVNDAGGVGGRRLRLESRDSNSGSQRGVDALLDLLYNEKVRYLVGPEENDLANEIVPDIKGLDVFNVLPGFASPYIERVGSRGAWLRLPPSPLAFGCGLSEMARENSVHTANSIVAQDDFNQAVFGEFLSYFQAVEGRTLPSITLRDSQQAYAGRVAKTVEAGADRTLLMVNPTAASNLLIQWVSSRGGGEWIFGPSLHTPGFLQNIPFDALDGTLLLAPTLHLPHECDIPDDEGYRGPVACSDENAKRFQSYFAERWDGAQPFPAAHFYYDAVVLIALGLQYAQTHGDDEPGASNMHRYVRRLIDEDAPLQGWQDVAALLASAERGDKIDFAGAATEYRFDKFGSAEHFVFDAWTIEEREYVFEGSLYAECFRYATMAGANSLNDDSDDE